MRELHKYIQQYPDRINIVLMMLGWLVMLFLANPQGNFPLNDDWNYARSVKTLAESFKLDITCWNCSTNLLLIFYSAVITKLFGFSFETLRLTTELFGIVGGIHLYLLIERVCSNRKIAFLAAAILLANPIYFNLANTFMTDIPFISLLIASMYYSVRSLQNGGKRDFVLTVVLAIAATYVRQYGSVFLFCFLVAHTWQKSFERKTLVKSVSILLLAAAGILLYGQWLKSTGTAGGCYLVWAIYLKQRLSAGPIPFLTSWIQSILTVLMYIGLFIVPFSIACFEAQSRHLITKEKVFALVTSSLFFFAVSAALLLKQLSMPMTTNVLLDLGVGPVLLSDIANAPKWVSLGPSFWLPITAISVFGFSLTAGMFAVESVHAKSTRTNNSETESKDNRKIVWRVFAAFFALYGLLITFTGLIDRYMLPCLPAICVLVAMLAKNDSETTHSEPISASIKLSKVNLATSITTTLCASLAVVSMITFCVLSTHDYFACNRARWQALDYARYTLKLHPFTIDGGWEFNGWVSYEPELLRGAKIEDMTMKHGDKYAVALGPVPGYRSIKKWEFQRWLLPDSCEIDLLEKL